VVTVVAIGSIGVGWLVPTVAGASHGTPEDALSANAGVLQAADFPSGWTPEVGQDHVSGLISAAEGVKQCKLYLASPMFGSAGPNGMSPDFVSTTNVVSNDATTVPSISLADATMASYRDATTGQCLGKALPAIVKKDLARDGKVGAVTAKAVKRLAPTVPLADATGGYRILMKASVGGKPTDVYVENWLVQVGRTLISYDFESRTTFDPSVSANATAASTARVDTASAGSPVAGESHYLAHYLPTVSGYTWEQPTAERLARDAAYAASVADMLNGLSSHSVRDSTGTTIAFVTLFEFKSEPGAAGSDTATAATRAKPENGGTGLAGNIVDVNGTSVHVVPQIDVTGPWTLRLFVCGRVLNWVEGYEDRGIPTAMADAFVEKYIAVACAPATPTTSSSPPKVAKQLKVKVAVASNAAPSAEAAARQLTKALRRKGYDAELAAGRLLDPYEEMNVECRYDLVEELLTLQRFVLRQTQIGVLGTLDPGSERTAGVDCIVIFGA
jgi:hypothetical protein